MTERRRVQPGRGSYLGPYAGSILLHVGVIALFGVGWWSWKRATPPPPRQLAIEAVVVDPQSLPGERAPKPSREEPPAAPPAAPPPPAPARDEVQERQRAEARQRAEDLRKAEEVRKAEEARKAQEQRKADEASKAAELRQANEARQRAQREADLRRSLEAEEHTRAVRASGAGAQWEALIRAKIESQWRRPPTARPGLECKVQVTQVPGGEVVAVRILSCNGDAAVRQSIEIAVMSASPLPPPPDPALFERNLEVTFRPND